MAKTTKPAKPAKKIKAVIEEIDSEKKAIQEQLSKCSDNSDILELKEKLIEITNEISGKEIEKAREYILSIERKRSFEQNYTSATMAIAVINFC